MSAYRTRLTLQLVELEAPISLKKQCSFCGEATVAIRESGSTEISFSFYLAEQQLTRPGVEGSHKGKQR